jgi:hypothetical protein
MIPGLSWLPMRCRKIQRAIQNACSRSFRTTSISRASWLRKRIGYCSTKAMAMPILNGGSQIVLSTKFRIGSLTKQFTAASVLLLQERGKLKIEEPARTYLPDAPKAWERVTLYSLLTHTSGIPNFTGSALPSPPPPAADGNSCIVLQPACDLAVPSLPRPIRVNPTTHRRPDLLRENQTCMRLRHF